VKGKEKQALGELYDLFGTLAEELWPESSAEDLEEDEDSAEMDIEKALAKELQTLKKAKKERRFVNCPIDSPCLLYLLCKPPVDPLVLIETHFKNIERTGVTHLRHTYRLLPVQAVCDARFDAIASLCEENVLPHFQKAEGVLRYKVEIRIRNHNTLDRDELIKLIAKSVPEPHKVDLKVPEVFILVEVFKTICGISVVHDYFRYKKFNVTEFCQSLHAAESGSG